MQTLKNSAKEREQKRKTQLQDKTVRDQGLFVRNFKHMFSVFKQHYMHFYSLFHTHVFPHMFSNNKIHVFKCMYQTLHIVRERIMSEREKESFFFFFTQVVFLIYFEVKI